jgi:MoaA/NifB/PqqE/SkfB family radical SAM enzyme
MSETIIGGAGAKIEGARAPLFQRLRYAPFLVQMVVIRRCNLACGYCNEFDGVSPPVPTELLKGRIGHARRLGAFSVEFTGGEPLLHPDLPELIRHAKSAGIFRVRLISNAFLLNVKKIEELNAAGLDHLQVSVDGIAPNDVTTKTLKPLRSRLEALARVAKFKVTLSGVIGSAVADDALEVVRFAKAHGFRPRVLLIHGPDGTLELGPDKQAHYRQVGKALGRRFAEAHDYRSRLLAGKPAPFKCRAGSRYFYVDEFGVVRWCSQQRERFGVSLATYAESDLRRQFQTRKGCEAHCTVGCARTNSARDEWRLQTLEPGLPPTPSPPAAANVDE